LSPFIGGLPDAGALEDGERLWNVGAGGTIREVFLRTQGRQLLGYCHIDELVERHTLGLGHPAGLVEKRGLKPQRKVALPHDVFSSCSIIRPS
jgi:hypothetical protein